MHSTNQLKAVLFDIDDTLFDRKTAVRNALLLMMEQLPDLFVGIQEERIFDTFKNADEIARIDFESGKSGEAVRDSRSKAFLRSLGLPKRFSKRITEQYIGAFPGVSAEVNGARAVIEGLVAEEYGLGIISNAFPDVQYNKLKGIGILEYFHVIVLAEECGIRKPDERIFHKAADSLRCLPHECLYVGNSFETDIVGAKNAGMKSCWFNADGKQIQEGNTEPDFEIAQLPQLLEILGVRS